MRPYVIERTVAATLRRTGIEKRLVLDGKPPKAHTRSVEALQRATLTALNVNQALLTGAVDSIKTIAKQDDVNERNLGHLLKLAFLSPDTITRIVNGDIAAEEDLQLTALKQRKSPLIWR
ncbi:MAG: hypothetical protein P8H97_03965 [Pseudomonadales bacterium]|nr:hypothetical protein [Pseudomonadales bacterium]